MIEPRRGTVDPPRQQIAVLSIASPADENQPTGLVTDYVAYMLKMFPHQSEARLMTAAYRRSLKVRGAAEKGQSLKLDRDVILTTIARSPTYLALLLDGRPLPPTRKQ